MNLNITDIIIDDTLYPRDHPYWQVIARYAAAMKAGSLFPPIVVGKRKHDEYVLLDGRHRLEASKQLDRDKIGAVITPEPEPRWFLESLRLNIQHGAALSYQDKLAGAVRLRNEGLSDTEIEQVIRIPIPQLNKAIAERVIPISTPSTRPAILKGSIVRTARQRGQTWVEQHASEILAGQRGLSVNDSVTIVRQLLTMLENDLIVSTDDDCCAELEALDSALHLWLKSHKKIAS